MKAYECDRCKKLFTRPYAPDIKVTKYIHPYGDVIVYDLCPDCLKELENWIGDSKKEEDAVD